MVRVNYQSGGGGRLSETAKESQTVRILKPPGGGSSISFGDEPVRKPSTPSKPEPETTAQPDPQTPTTEPKTPEEVTTVEEKSPECPATGPTSRAPTVEEASPAKQVPSPEKTNVQVVTPESNGLSNAGQRGRVPPGGFSSKLW